MRGLKYLGLWLIFMAHPLLAINDGCVTNCLTWTTQIVTVCASGCSATSANNALTQTSSTGCICLQGDITQSTQMNLSRSVGVITSDGSFAAGTMRNWYMNAVGAVIFVGAPQSLSSVINISNIHMENNASSAGVGRVLQGQTFGSSGAWPTGSGLHVYDCDLISSQPGGTAANLDFNSNSFTAGATLLIERCRVGKTSAAIGSTPKLFDFNATLPNVANTIVLRNILSDSGSLTTTTATSALGIKSGPQVPAPYEFDNILFTGLSSSAKAIQGTDNFLINNCVFYTPNAGAYEFDTSTAGNIVVPARVTAQNNAFQNLTAFAGAGNIFSSSWASSFYDPANGNFKLSGRNSALFNAGIDLTGSGVIVDILGVARPQAISFDIGPYEQPDFFRTVPAANVRMVP